MVSIVYNALFAVVWGLYAALGEPTAITWMALGFHSAALFFSILIEFGYNRARW